MNKNRNESFLKQRLMSSIGNSAIRFQNVAVGAGIIGALMLAAPYPASAMNLYDGTQYGNNLEINLTTTVSYTGQYRVNDPSAVLLGSDGDNNFKHGIVGNLFEAVPILDLRDGDFGAHFSTQIYINTPYLGTNQNTAHNDFETWSNALYVNKPTDFTSGTRNVDGLNQQWLDAFVFGQHEFANGQSLQVKIGRSVLFWGQSLYFPTDGISGGQAPINVISAQNLINPEAQQVYMPTGQAIITYQPIPGTTFQGYYQFEWQHDYFQGEGAYFNVTNAINAGGGFINFGAAAGYVGLLRTKDLTPPSQNGQFGLGFKQAVGRWDLGLFGERFDAKAPEVGLSPGASVLQLIHGYPIIGTYTVIYPRDIWLQGASFSTNIGAANVAGELSAREHQPLVTPNGSFIIMPGTNANGNPSYPVGDTWDAQLSGIYLSPAVPLDPGGVSFSGEIILNHLISVTDNRAGLVQGGQATAGAFNFTVSPTYYDVLPSLNLAFPIGLEYNYLGRSQVDPSLYHGTGTFNVGVTGTYRGDWIASLAYQDYLGAANAVKNALADRGYVALNLQHTF